MSWRAALVALAVLAMAMIPATPALGIGTGVGTGAGHPVDTTFTASGPFATTTGSITVGGTSTYDLFYPARYAALRFKSPVITWGNGTNAIPPQYTTLLMHFASWGFTVIAPTLTNTGSGREIDAAAHYLVAQDTVRGSPFFGHLAVHHVASVGHSQGATGAVRAATADPRLITAVLTFSLPARIYSGANPDCPTSADCTPHPGLLTQPVFLVSTLGPLDGIIDDPANARLEYRGVRGRAAMGVIKESGGRAADHNSVQTDPAGELGYATAWLEYTLRGDRLAAAAFTGRHPELTTNPDWPVAAVK